MEKKREAWWNNKAPSFYAQIYLNVAKARGVDPNLIMKKAGVDSLNQSQPNTEMPVFKIYSLLQTLIKETGDYSIGLDIGMQMPPTVFGNLGYALICSEKISDVLNILQKYWPLIVSGVDMKLVSGNSTTALEISSNVPIPESHLHFFYEVSIASFYRCFNLLASPAPEEIEIFFSTPTPKYEKKVESLLGSVTFGAPKTEFRFSNRLLEKTLPMHNPIGLNFALEQCDRDLQHIDSNKPLSHQVYKMIVIGNNGYPDLEQICDQMNMSSRTLRRRLSDEGTNFKSLLLSIKKKDAIRLLDESTHHIHKIAHMLGYNEPANFTRAFNQWTGVTPSEYRAAREKVK